MCCAKSWVLSQSKKPQVPKPPLVLRDTGDNGPLSTFRVSLESNFLIPIYTKFPGNKLGFAFS